MNKKGFTEDTASDVAVKHTEKASASRYVLPEIFEVGRATDLVQSYSSGKYSDGYTGYYWER